MIHSVKFKCILDTNVIYPLWIRDLLMWFAHYELYTPKWSNTIFDEWIAVMERKGIVHEEAIQQTTCMHCSKTEVTLYLPEINSSFPPSFSC